MHELVRGLRCGPAHRLLRGLALAAGLALGPAYVARADAPESSNAHWQSTYVWQRKPSLRSPYQGPHSLIGERERSYSLTATAALGARIGQTEFYVDPEMALGVPLSGLQGLAGFSNGEMARTSGPNPTFYFARAFVRHVIGLGDASTSVDGAANQLASPYAKQRFVLTAGTLSVLDLFDASSVSHDPRTQFMNWALMTHAAFDYPADSRGYTRGAAIEYVADGWSMRAARFAQPREPNQLALDNRLLRHYGDVLETAIDYGIGRQTGTVRMMAFRNRAVMASYADALTVAAQSGGTPDLASVRNGEKTKVGIGASVDHRVSDSFGVFARAMWADGKTETYAFTEADRSVSAGAAIDGRGWGRPKDRFGVAAAASLLSASHLQLLQAGGLTFFLGDGRLRYRAEKVVEAYYSVGVTSGSFVTLDYQRIASPGYNADRGPASFIAVRLHWER